MSHPPLRVLVLADSRAFHTERYVDELLRQGCEVLTASLENGAMEHHRLQRKGPFRVLHYPLAVQEVRRLVSRFQPDAVNPHFASGYGFMAALAKRPGFPPILLHLWGSDILIVPAKSSLHRRKTRTALAAADIVTGDSDYILDRAESLNPLAARETIVWGIERRYLSARRASFPLDEPLKIIVPRVQEPIYNNRFIVTALAPLIKTGRVNVMFSGFGSRLRELKSHAAALVGHGVEFYDKRSRDDYLSLLAEHDVYLSASFSDSSPVSMIEAMGLGLIPVVGDIPGVREWITSETGFRFDLNDGPSLRKAVEDILEGRRDLSAMRRRNIDRVERDAIFEDNISRMIQLMRGLTRPGRGA